MKLQAAVPCWRPPASGSCTDCGMEQGRDTYENQPLPVPAGEVDCVLITHAHIDHTGLLPLLVRNGFGGEIYATTPTVELCGIMLRDSAHIQEFEAEWKNRKGQRSGADPVEPMYTVQDAEAAIKLFHGVPYNTQFALAPGVEVRFVDVGHLLGSASVEILGHRGRQNGQAGVFRRYRQPESADSEISAYLHEADYVVMESTYGDRSHGPRPDYVGELSAILQRTLDRGGNVVIPSFAVGRTQEMLYFIREIKTGAWSKGTAISRSISTVRWPLKRPASSMRRILPALIRKHGSCWHRESTRSCSRGCGSA